MTSGAFQSAQSYPNYLSCVSWIDIYSEYFGTSDYQFGFKKRTSCSHVVYSVRNVIDHYVSHCSTVNVCTLDLSKAFNRMNHCVLFTKLIERNLPFNLLHIIEKWFTMSETCASRGGQYILSIL